MDIRDLARSGMEKREYVKETVKSMVEQVVALNPQNWLPAQAKGEEIIPKDKQNAIYRDFIDNAASTMNLAWKPVSLIMEDVTNFMEATVAESARTFEKEHGNPGDTKQAGSSDSGFAR